MSDENTTTEGAPEATEDATTEAPAKDAAELGEVEPEAAWDPQRAKEKIRKLNQEVRATKERLANAPKAEDVTAKERRIADLEATALRYEVAFDLGLPKQIAERLKGSSREEMVEDAEKLLELIAPAGRPATQKPREALRGGLEPDREPEETDLSKLGERMFRR